MKGIWLQSQNVERTMPLIGEFDVVYLDPKNDYKANQFIRKWHNRLDIWVCLNCFEGRDPGNPLIQTDLRIKAERYAMDKRVKGIILDFIRFERFNLRFDIINKFAKQIQGICGEFDKEIKFTIMPRALFMGQNPWHLNKLGTLCPMLYYDNPFWVKIMSWCYGEKCEPILKAWDTTLDNVNKLVESVGERNYSLFRYITLKDMFRR